MSKGFPCKSTRKLSQLQQNLLRSEAQLFVQASHVVNGQRIFMTSPPRGSLACGRKRRSTWWTTLGAYTSKFVRGTQHGVGGVMS